MTIKGDSDSDSDVLSIPLDLARCMVHLKHRLPTAEEIASLKQYCLTQGDFPWNPSSFSDQMADKFYQQVIEMENYNIRLGFSSKDPPVTVVDKVSQDNHQKMPFYDPADLHMNNVDGKPAHLMFYWFEPVLYLDPVSKFPETTERPGHFVGFADNVGDKVTFKILKNDLSTVLHRSDVRSAADANHRNIIFDL
jgi:hypothetical protein